MSDKKDIDNREDLLVLMHSFYKKLLADISINYLFTDIAKVNLDPHFPVLADFWDSILFQSGTYQKNAMQPHLVLHHKSPLTKHHFETWLRYFKESVNYGYARRFTTFYIFGLTATHQQHFKPCCCAER